jgi:hypothetical protein
MNLTTLGLPTARAPQAYVPGLALAPAPTHPTFRRNIQRNYTPPTSRLDPVLVQRGGAVVGGLAAALAQLDHFARQLQGLGQMKPLPASSIAPTPMPSRPSPMC